MKMCLLAVVSFSVLGTMSLLAFTSAPNDSPVVVSRSPAFASVPATARIVRYSTTLFRVAPGGCDAYLHGDVVTGQTFWGGCSTSECPGGDDCQASVAGPVMQCACPGGGGQATCWAEVTMAPDGDTVTGVTCHLNGCAGGECSVWLWWEGDFFPCRC